jgi:DNA-binding NtrC family response regulator
MRLLVVGAYDAQIGAASKMAKERGASVTHSPDIDAALAMLRAGKGADLVMVDVRQNIRKLTDALKEERFFMTVIAFGVEAKSEDAAAAIRAGAKEFLPLPPDEKLIAAVLEAITEETQSVIYKSAPMEKVIKLALQVAPSDAHVIISGESGTGKEVIANYIHRKSKRAGQPFISVNCAAIPEQLLESELFGHEKGAFTGAVAQRIGKFEEANNGTLLLDEISEMDIRLQAKLLRAIQEKQIDRVGGNKPVKLNLRILATTNRDLKKEVEQGRFREDLYFRLNVIHLQLPALRQRKEDIQIFTEYFIKKYSQANSVNPLPLSPKAVERLMGYHWPGNVRELENTMHRAVLLASGKVIDDEAIILSEESEQAAPGIAAGIKEMAMQSFVGRSLDEVERELILGTLSHCLGNRTHAANILGISIRTLRNKLKEYGETLEAEEA